MPVLSTSEFRSKLSEWISKAAFGRERVIVQRHGKDAVALVPIEDLRALEALEDKADVAAAKRARREESISLDELRASLDL